MTQYSVPCAERSRCIAASYRRIAAIHPHAVVGEDTNNGRWPNGDMKRIVASDENENLSPDSLSALCSPAANAAH